MDALRGIAITLVVYLHSADSMSLKFDDLAPIFTEINGYFSPFRMPALMLLSGLLVAGSMRKGAGRYFTGKLSGILYPYVIWSVVSYGLFLYRAHFNGKTPPDFWHSLFFEPMAYLWFIYYIFFYYVIAFFVLRLHWAVSILGSLALYLFLKDTEFDRFIFHLPFFIAGGVLGYHLQAFKHFIERTSWLAVLALIALVGWYVMAYHGMVATGGSYQPISMVLALAMTLVLLRVVTFRWSATVLRPFEWFGRNSLVLFLVHFPVTWVAPVVLTRIVHGNPDVVFPFYFLGVMAVSSLAAVMNNRSKLVSLLFTANLFLNRRAAKRHEERIGNASVASK
ncbi:acyltransferase family protein [Kushneria avicenniae]|nr:acyltransferase [Kushneria avicenniae]